jgi:hypothetical protein
MAVRNRHEAGVINSGELVSVDSGQASYFVSRVIAQPIELIYT